MSVIYTAITGRYDNLKPHPPVKNCKFIAFVDNLKKYRVEGWELRKVISFHSDPIRNAKQYKVLAHEHLPQTTYSLWIDGNISIKEGFDLDIMIKEFLAKHDLALFKHQKRNCIYRESQACCKRRLEDPHVIDKQITRYRSEGYPENHGLTENGVILRRHSPLIAQLNTVWWKEICEGSRRDQLSFMYSMWKTKTTFATLPGSIIRYNPFFSYNRHSHSRSQFQPAP